MEVVFHHFQDFLLITFEVVKFHTRNFLTSSKIYSKIRRKIQIFKIDNKSHVIEPCLVRVHGKMSQNFT